VTEKVSGDDWNGLYKDRVKLGISPSTEVITIGCHKITVDAKYFEAIEKSSHLLECLDACGVCDWEGYSEALAMYEEERE